MKVVLKSDHPLTDESVKAATGRTWAEWFAYLDVRGGPSQGRREIGNHLYADLKVDHWWVSAINVQYESHCGVKEKDGRGKGYFICSTKTIAAPVAKVYGAWASASSLDAWFGGGNSHDPADGVAFENADGNRGEFKRVRPNKDLRFSWQGDGADSESIVDVVFQDKGGGKTGLLVNHDRIQSREEADGLRAAWAEALNRLKSAVEA